MIVTVAGISVGAAAALGLTRLMGSLLYGVPPDDPATFAVVAATMAAAALLAVLGAVAASGAGRPVAALRSE